MNSSFVSDATLADLATERSFLLASLADLEAESDAGAIDEPTYRELSEDYTARAAAVIRELETQRAAQPRRAAPTPRRWQPVVVWGLIVVFLAASAVALWRGLDNRDAGEALTGRNPEAQSIDDQRALLEADVARNPQNPAVHRALAQFLLQQQQYADALRQFDQAAALDPLDAQSRAYAGWVLQLAGLPDRAIVRLDDAIAVDPSFADAYFFRGIVLFRGLGQPAAAIPDFERFLALAPDNPLAEQVQSVLGAARQATNTNATTVTPNTTTK